MIKRFFIPASVLSLTFLVGCNEQKETTQKITIANESKQTMEHTKTESGLSYKIEREGNGAITKKGDTVFVHYTGWLDNNGEPGKKFDSSVDRGTPFSFKLGIGHVIKGWDEGVEGMKVGEKRRLVIPAHIGYGARGAGAIIPPNATLIFDVELLKIS